jgi:hypothetical protein
VISILVLASAGFLYNVYNDHRVRRRAVQGVQLESPTYESDVELLVYAGITPGTKE